MGWVAVLGGVGAAEGVEAQSVLERTPNLAGGWTGVRGQAYFTFNHRFERLPPPTRKIVNYPTLLLGYAPVDGLLAALSYASNSPVVLGEPNEWELLARWSPLEGSEGAPLDVAVTAAWNGVAASGDGAVSLGRRVGPLRLLAELRGFTDGYGAGDSRAAWAAGAVLRLGPVAVAGDVGRLLDPGPREETAWGAALQLPIPYSPHTLSLQASNAPSTTLQGSSLGGDEVRWGFEFTVPLTLSRYFGGGDEGVAPAPAAAPTRTGPAPADTVEIGMANLAYARTRVEVAPGTLVRWVNRDQVAHTATATAGGWDSGLLEPGQAWERVFEEAGEHAYHCVPHPFMRGVVVVR